MAQLITGSTHYRDVYSRRASGSDAGSPAWLRSLRNKAMDRFSELGFPTLGEEEWKYTDVRPIAETEFHPANYDPADLSVDKIRELTFDDSGMARLVFVNGHFSNELSAVPTLPDGVRVESLAQTLDADPGLLSGRLGALAQIDQQAFTALNTALFEDGPFILVPERVTLETAIHVVYAVVPGAAAIATHPRALILLGQSAQATVIESFVATGGVYFTNAVTEISVARNAVLDHYKIQQEGLQAFHIASIEARQEAASVLTTHNISLGGQLARNDIHDFLAGEGAEGTLNGLYLCAGRQHMDTHTLIEHAAPHCPSHELYKGIMDGSSRAVFNGKIHVHPDAQKTDAKQTNQNILLSRDAQVNTKPQLEIYADDVRCTHGATIGQLDEDALFYMRARGIGKDEARSLLTFAFASDIISRIRVAPLRDRLEESLFTLRGSREEAVSLVPAEGPQETLL